MMVRGPTETGMKRLALSDEDKEVRLWLKSELGKLGCEVKVDQMGNMFGKLNGRNEGYMTAMGSHLDTQPTGELLASSSTLKSWIEFLI